MMTPPTNTLRYWPSQRSATTPPRIAATQPLLPQLDVEAVLLLQGAALRGGEVVERGEQLGDRLAQRLHLKAGVARAHVLEDALLGARGDDRLRAPLDEHVSPALGATIFFDGHQPEDRVRAPVLAVPEKDHAIALDVHGASGTSSVLRRPVPVPLPQRVADGGPQTTERAHRLRRARTSWRTTRSIFPSIRTRTS